MQSDNREASEPWCSWLCLERADTAWIILCGSKRSLFEPPLSKNTTLSHFSTSWNDFCFHSEAEQEVTFFCFWYFTPTSPEPRVVVFLSTELASRFFNCPKINCARTPISGVWHIEWDTWVNKQIMQQPLAFLIIADNLDCLHTCVQNVVHVHQRESTEHSGLSSPSSYFTLIPQIHQTVMAPSTVGRDFVAQGQFDLSF